MELRGSLGRGRVRCGLNVTEKPGHNWEGLSVGI